MEPQIQLTALRWAINKPVVKHKAMAMLVLWPRVAPILNCVAKQVCDREGQNANSVLLEVLLAGTIASDAVGSYQEGCWPLRSVDAFLAAVTTAAAPYMVSLECQDAPLECLRDLLCARASTDHDASLLLRWDGPIMRESESVVASLRR